MVRIVASRPPAGLPGYRLGAFRAIVRQLRAGHPGAEARMAACIGSGVRFLLGRKAAGRAPDGLVEAALQRICLEIREGWIDNPGGVVRLLREFSSEAAAPLRAGRRAGRSPGPVKEILSTFREQEREALRRYYVQGESLEQILRQLAIPIDSFLELRARLRSAGTAAPPSHGRPMTRAASAG